MSQEEKDINDVLRISRKLKAAIILYRKPGFRPVVEDRVGPED